MGLRKVYSVRDYAAMNHEFNMLSGTAGATIAAGGSLAKSIDLGDGTVGNCTKVKIHEVRVDASASTDFDFEIYDTNSRESGDLAYQNIDNNRFFCDQAITPMPYFDREGLNGSLHPGGSLHMTFVNTDAVNGSAFTYTIYYTKVE